MNKQTLRYLLSALLTIVFLYVAFRGTDLAAFLDSLQRADYWWILAMFALLIGSHAVRAWRWRYLLEPIKPAIGMRSLFSGVMVGYMVNNVLPRAGELVRPYTIGKLEGISKSAAFGTIIVERIIDTIAFLVLVALVPLVYNGPLRETFPWLDDARFIVSVATAAFVVVLVVMMIRRDWTDKLLGLFARVLSKRLALVVEQLTHQFLDGFLFLKRPKHFGLIFLQSVAIWYLYICMVYVAFFAFDLNLDFSAAIVVQAISSIGVAIPTPGGTGSYHMFASQSLSKLFGVSNTIALSYATVTHGFGYIGTMIIGAYFFLRDHIKVSEAVATPAEQLR
jgi:hypothetical protein